VAQTKQGVDHRWGVRRDHRAAYSAPLILPGQQRVLVPGPVNGHTHAAMALFRGIARRSGAEQWRQVHLSGGRHVRRRGVRSRRQTRGLRAIIASAAIDSLSRSGLPGLDDSFAAAVAFVQRWKGERGQDKGPG
jgi:5-methylthioadenosine/S-adenosylhomocysteine deaminase